MPKTKKPVGVIAQTGFLSDEPRGSSIFDANLAAFGVGSGLHDNGKGVGFQ